MIILPNRTAKRKTKRTISPFPFHASRARFKQCVRLIEADQWDTQAWQVLVNEAQQGNGGGMGPKEVLRCAPGRAVSIRRMMPVVQALLANRAGLLEGLLRRRARPNHESVAQ